MYQIKSNHYGKTRVWAIVGDINVAYDVAWAIREKHKVNAYVEAL